MNTAKLLRAAVRNGQRVIITTKDKEEIGPVGVGSIDRYGMVTLRGEDRMIRVQIESIRVVQYE